MNEPDYASALVTDAQLAAILGVSARRVRQLAETGALERVARGRFELGPSIRALLEHAAGNGSELQRARTRKVRADADLAELEFAKAKGLVAPISEFERVQTARNALIRLNVFQVPGRAVLRLLGETQEARFKSVLREELTTALKTAATAEIDLPPDEDTDHADD